MLHKVVKKNLLKKHPSYIPSSVFNGRNDFQCIEVFNFYQNDVNRQINIRYQSGIAADAGAFTFAAFISGALLNAIPGIVVQLILVPAVVVALQKAKLIEAPSAEKA